MICGISDYGILVTGHYTHAPVLHMEHSAWRNLRNKKVGTKRQCNKPGTGLSGGYC